MSYYPYDYASLVEAAEWHLSPEASIAVIVCLPVTALLFAIIGYLVGYENGGRRKRTLVTPNNNKDNKDNYNQNNNHQGGNAGNQGNHSANLQGVGSQNAVQGGNGLATV